MLRVKKYMLMLLVSVLLVGCATAPASQNPNVDDIVAETLAALTAEAEQVIPNPDESPVNDSASQQSTGVVTGSLSYPSSFIPAMTVVAFRVSGPLIDYYYTVTDQNDATYTISEMSNGEYYIVAYPLENTSFAGGYTQAVPCGLSVECTDHSLIPVLVEGGVTTSNINPGDWYASPGTFPAYPLP